MHQGQYTSREFQTSTQLSLSVFLWVSNHPLTTRIPDWEGEQLSRKNEWLHDSSDAFTAIFSNQHSVPRLEKQSNIQTNKKRIRFATHSCPKIDHENKWGLLCTYWHLLKATPCSSFGKKAIQDPKQEAHHLVAQRLSATSGEHQQPTDKIL